MRIQQKKKKKSHSWKSSPLSACFTFSVPTLPAFVALGYLGKVCGGMQRDWGLQGPVESSTMSTWGVWRAQRADVEKKGSCFCGTRKWLSVPAAAFHSHMAWGKDAAAVNSLYLSNRPPGSCCTSPAASWLRYLSCAEQSPLSRQPVQLGAVPRTTLQNTDACFLLHSSSAQLQDPRSRAQALRGTSV